VVRDNLGDDDNDGAVGQLRPQSPAKKARVDVATGRQRGDKYVLRLALDGSSERVGSLSDLRYFEGTALACQGDAEHL